MASLLDDIASFLTSSGLVGGATGWTVAKGGTDPSPDKIITLGETGGPEPELSPSGSTETTYDEPTFQVRGRGEAFGYEALRAKMGAIYVALHGSVLGKSTDYVLVRAVQSGPLSLGLDSNDRPMLTWNFSALRRRGA